MRAPFNQIKFSESGQPHRFVMGAWIKPLLQRDFLIHKQAWNLKVGVEFGNFQI